MKLAFFDTHAFERECFERENRAFLHTLVYFDARLTETTAVLATGFEGICVFANDRLDAGTLTILAKQGVRLIALRSAGFNHVDLKAAKELGLRVVRVPKYSPYSVAEHAVALLLSLVRKTHRAHARVRELNFSLEGLMGFDLHGKTVGVVGTGNIGQVFSRILLGFGCQVLAHDLVSNDSLIDAGVKYVPLPRLFSESDIVSLHVPLTSGTRHLIDDKAINLMKPGVFLINTGRGALIDTGALIRGLKSGRLGAAGLDVYEEEENVFFKDLSSAGLKDDHLARLLTFPNVLITSHQGFLTVEALTAIAQTTLRNASDYERNAPLINEVAAPIA